MSRPFNEPAAADVMTAVFVPELWGILLRLKFLTPELSDLSYLFETLPGGYCVTHLHYLEALFNFCDRGQHSTIAKNPSMKRYLE